MAVGFVVGRWIGIYPIETAVVNACHSGQAARRDPDGRRPHGAALHPDRDPDRRRDHGAGVNIVLRMITH